MIVLDTHVVIWLALEPARISRKARALIDDTRQRGEALAISDVTLLEVATLKKKQRVKFDTSLETFLSEVESRFAVLPMTARVCVRAMDLPAAYPKDPADRIIAATALVAGVPLVTADDEIRSSRVVSTVW